MPGTKWSTVLDVGSMGIRPGAVHVWPFVDVLITTSFDEHPARNRQSYQTTNTLPAASTSADTMSSARTPPAGVCCWKAAMVLGPLYVTPPSADTKDSANPMGFEPTGTTTC